MYPVFFSTCIMFMSSMICKYFFQLPKTVLFCRLRTDFKIMWNRTLLLFSLIPCIAVRQHHSRPFTFIKHLTNGYFVKVASLFSLCRSHHRMDLFRFTIDQSKGTCQYLYIFMLIQHFTHPFYLVHVPDVILICQKYDIPSAAIHHMIKVFRISKILFVMQKRPACKF